MKETEQLFKQLSEFMKLHEDEITDEKSEQDLIDRFMAMYNAHVNDHGDDDTMTAEDYLELAMDAPSKKKHEEYLKKALELEPNNVDVGCQLVFSEKEKKPLEALNALKVLIDKEEERLRKEGEFEYVGDFWAIVETRPYMRARFSYFNLLADLGMIHRAIDEGNEMLRLCENDNLGVRYSLMHLYALLEDEVHALALHKKFDEQDETQMLLPLAILYYKLGQFDRAEDYLKRLSAVNPDTKKFMKDLSKQEIDEAMLEQNPYGYRPFTYEELLVELEHSALLFSTVTEFPSWAYEHLPKRTRTSKKKK